MTETPTEQSGAARTLILIPMLHAQADLGDVGERVRHETVSSGGRRSWERKQRKIESLWAKIKAWADAYESEGRVTRLYQDGLPVCGKEMDIVKDLAGSGSPNHQILLGLVERGSQLMGTEDPELLLREYKLITDPPASIDATQEAHAILELRDAFMASRIDSTLQAGEAGILFIGALHNITPKLNTNINIQHPFDIEEELAKGAAA